MSRPLIPAIWAGQDFACNLNEDNAKLLSSKYSTGLGTVHVGEVIETSMDAWINESFD